MGSDSGLSRSSGCPKKCEARAIRWQNRTGCQGGKVALIRRKAKESACQPCSAEPKRGEEKRREKVDKKQEPLVLQGAEVCASRYEIAGCASTSRREAGVCVAGIRSRRSPLCQIHQPRRSLWTFKWMLKVSDGAGGVLTPFT